jgi:hypothetical protein
LRKLSNVKRRKPTSNGNQRSFRGYILHIMDQHSLAVVSQVAKHLGASQEHPRTRLLLAKAA